MNCTSVNKGKSRQKQVHLENFGNQRSRRPLLKKRYSSRFKKATYIHFYKIYKHNAHALIGR